MADVSKFALWCTDPDSRTHDSWTYGFMGSRLMILLYNVNGVTTQIAPLCCQTIPHQVYIPISNQILVRDITTRSMDQGQTLSQSSFERVIGSALLKLLKVFSNISWYASLRDTWYLLSSSSINARIFEADELSPEVIPGGKLKLTSCVVMSCTWLQIHKCFSRATNWIDSSRFPVRNSAHGPKYSLLQCPGQI